MSKGNCTPIMTRKKSKISPLFILLLPEEWARSTSPAFWKILSTLPRGIKKGVYQSTFGKPRGIFRPFAGLLHRGWVAPEVLGSTLNQSTNPEDTVYQNFSAVLQESRSPHPKNEMNPASKVHRLN